MPPLPQTHRENPATSCPPLGSGAGIVAAQTNDLEGAETGSLLQHAMSADVRFGSIADMQAKLRCPLYPQ